MIGPPASRKITLNVDDQILQCFHPTRFNNIRGDALDHRGDKVPFIQLVFRDFLDHIADDANLIGFFSCDMFVAHCTTHNAHFPHQHLFILFPDPLCFTQCINKPVLYYQVCLQQIQIMVDVVGNGYIFGLAPCK